MRVLLFLLFGFLVLASCQSKKPHVEQLDVERKAVMLPSKIPGLDKDILQATSLGNSSDPFFSPDSNKILFISRNRPHHDQGEVYELDLAEKKERRLTFQDGENYSPTYLTPQKILYLSTTDEIKEFPDAIRKQFNQADNPELFPGYRLDRTEIYVKNLETDEIQRVTNHPGFDGFVYSFSPERLFYQSLRGQDLVPVFHLMKSGRSQSQLNFGKNMSFVTYSERLNLMAWTDFSKEGTSKILVRDRKRLVVPILVDKVGVYRDLSWHPSEPVLFFSSDWAHRGQFSIYQFNLAGKCLKQLITTPQSVIQPRLSPNLKSLAVVTDYGPHLQIFLVPYLPEKAECL